MTVLPDWGGKDLKFGTLRAAVRQLGLDWEAFENAELTNSSPTLELMKLMLPNLELTAGTMYCLHVPEGYHNSKPELEVHLLDLAARVGKSAAVSQRAMQSRGIWSWFREQRSVEWLAKAGGISRERAAAMIAEFQSPVGEVLARNAGNPRCLLGLAALIAREIEVIVYATSGCDPRGILDVHRYASRKRSERCFVHLSIPASYGNGKPAQRHCPATTVCVALSPSH
jgi:hypothetical protein